MPRTLSRRELFVPIPVAAPPLVAAEVHFLSRATFGPTPESLAELQSSDIASWLEKQFDPGGVDDRAFEALLPGIVAPTSNSGADIRLLARALFSKRQLAARMTHFLNNHFSTYRPETTGISESQEDDVFLKACFTTFHAVLHASACSPAMIDYLDSQSNVAASPNENYARELMELHTLGVNGGYTEPDVAAIARVFTGWSRVNVTNGTTVTGSHFRFRANVHATGPKTTSLGWSTPGFSGPAGVDEGLSFLAFLAAHPNTATRFVTKLCQYFVADQPPAGLLARTIQRFTTTGGDLKETLRAIFLDAEFALAGNGKAKVHDGFEFAVGAIRRLGLTTVNFANVNSRIAVLRSQPHHFPAPTGQPENGESWQGAGNVLSRWDFADDLVHDRIGGVVIPWTALFGAVPPTAGALWVGPLLTRLVDGEVPPTTVLALTVFMDARLAALPANPTWSQVRPSARALASLVLRLPEAQLH